MDSKARLKHCIKVAMGEEAADIVFVGGKIVSTFTEEILETEVAIAQGQIVALGNTGKAKETIDLKGAYLAPSFIDAHIHVESSMATPEGFAEVVVPRGTGTTISDPHEIVNVLGLAGLEYMRHASKDLPLDILYSIPSCVPATHMETAGAEITAKDIKTAYENGKFTPSLSEMMNYPGVYFADEGVLDKILMAQDLGLSIDGHSPMLQGKLLNAYLNAGISTDHECVNVEEAQEKLRKGMYVLIREGSAARNLDELVKIISDQNIHRLCISTDDRHPDELVELGHLDYTLRKLIKAGINPTRAIRLLTLNPATCYRLPHLGGIGVGYRANLVVLDNLENPKVTHTYFNGKLVALEGKIVKEPKRKDASSTFGSVHLPSQLEEKLAKYPKNGKVRAIGVIEGQLVSESLSANAADVATDDLAYLAVVERHGKNGQVGLGFVKGMGINSGALASTVAHDNHNLILLGKNIKDMLKAAQVAKEIQGGFVVVEKEQVKASVSLPVAGLMSLQKTTEIARLLQDLDKQAKSLGVKVHSPFMVLSFLALAVIPHLKLTDHGLVDVDKFSVVPLTIKN